MEIILSLLAFTHVAAAVTTLTAGFVAVLSKSINIGHQVHVLCGRIFFWSMFVIFLTAVPMSIVSRNVFLLLIAIYSFYFALSGWCYAKNRQGVASPLDWIRSIGMFITAIVMAVYGFSLLSGADTNGYTMLVFSGIGFALSVNDLRIIFTGGVTGAERIANHLTMMLAASIAAITAFSVVNVPYEPAYVVWLLPTVVITPVIVVWNFKIRRGSAPKGVPEADV